MSHITLRFEEAPLMRLSVGTLRQVVKRDLSIAFVPQQLTSYGGLELLRRYVRRIELPRRLQAACAALGGDYGGARLALLLVALPYVGAWRLEHLQYLVGDPLVRRFAGLARVPTARTVSNWLRRFTQETLRPVIRLNQDLVLDTLARLDVPRLTLDVDGTIVRTGATVAWAFRGFNPHHRKDRSYYPLLAHVAQTGHILRIKNRPGNVHDSKQSAAFLRELIDGVRGRLGRRLPLEFRMDAAFFQPDVLQLLARRRWRAADDQGPHTAKILAAPTLFAPPLRRDRRVPTTQHPRPHRRADLPPRHHRHSPPPLPQAHVRLCPAQHADLALLPDPPSRAADSYRGPQCPPPRAEPGDRGPLRPHSACARGLSCSENPDGSPRPPAARSSVTRYPWRSSSWTARRVTRSPCRRSK